MELDVIGVDIAKHVFEVCGVDGSGQVVLRRRLSRQGFERWMLSQPGLRIGLESCATSHYWARRLIAAGHDVQLYPPRHVKSFVLRNKTDAADALGICKAMRDATVHPVPVKSEVQQAVLAVHRVRDQLVRQRTMNANALRSHLAEFGIVRRCGVAGLAELVADLEEADLPGDVCAALDCLVRGLMQLDGEIAELERRLASHCRRDPTARRLATIPGIGPLTATALAASAPEPGAFRNGRQFAAWLGLVPRQYSSGLKRRSGGISKQGDVRLRRLLVLGAHSRMRAARPGRDPWLDRKRSQKPVNLVACALANKMARAAWAIMMRETGWQATPPAGKVA